MDENDQGEQVMRYEKGSYFGEMALMNSQERAASVRAETDMKLAVLDKEGFSRLFGKAENELKKKEKLYIGQD